MVGTDDSQDALDRALKANAGASCTRGGFNACYNALALARHNDYREGHEKKSTSGAYTLTPLLRLNEKNAAALQEKMNEFTSVTNTLESYLSTHLPAGCQMSFYTAEAGASAAELVKSHAATDSWYGGGAHYDDATGTYRAASDAAAQKKADAYTRMLWRGTKTVAFGIKGT